MSGQDKLKKFDKKFLGGAMRSQINIRPISENKTARWTYGAKSDHMDKLANLNLPP